MTRAEDILFRNQNEFFEVLGYLAKSGRLVSIDAEIPLSKVPDFIAEFGNVRYTPIDEGITVSGMPGKVGPQYRINIATIINVPTYLTEFLGIGRGTNIAARINKSLFVKKLVSQYGFMFGSTQNTENIRSTIPPQFINDFERGLNR